MSKKKKMEQQAKQNDVFQRLDEVAQKKINGEETKEVSKGGLMDVIRKAKPPKFGSETKENEPSDAQLAAAAEMLREGEPSLPSPSFVTQSPTPESKPDPKKAEEPTKATPAEPTKVIPKKPEKSEEEPPAWAKELVASQKSFQDSVRSAILKTGKALDQHEAKLDGLEKRLSDLEAWKETAVKAEKAKAEIKAEAAEAEKPEPAPEPKPAPAPEPEPEPEPVIKIDPGKNIKLHMESTILRPAMSWRARIVGKDGKVSHSEPFANIYVANRFATVDMDVEPVFGWIDSNRRFVREMDEEELKKYGKYF